MLTRMRFKNWRSLKDVTIDDLTPITVLIGANSSGKTNIVDALKFVRDYHELGLLRAVNDLEYMRILRDAISSDDQRVEIALTHQLPISSDNITDELVLKFDKRTVPFKFESTLYEGNDIFHGQEAELPTRDEIGPPYAYFMNDELERREKRVNEINSYLSSSIRRRWQILSDQFMPKLRLSRREGGDPYILETDARNTLIVLDFMQQVAPNLYEKLVEKATSLLPHISSVEIDKYSESDSFELLIRERTNKAAWTISTGTARVLAILTAIFALRMPQETNETRPTDPGLIILEEPDTSLSHWQYAVFVSMLRSFAEDWGIQFILTTHNPAFLDLFKLEEVRLVKRDSEGVTTVEKLPDDIREIWLEDYGLGEVWMTNSFQDMPE